MLERFYDNDDDFQDEYFDDKDDRDDEEAEFINYVNREELVNSIQDMEMFEMELNTKILKMSINLAKESWFWSFYSIKRKISKIKETYKLLDKIIFIDNFKEEK